MRKFLVKKFLGTFADITRNSFNDYSNRKKVEFQLGVPPVDNEMNELQDIIMAEATEGVQSVFSSVRATDTGTPMRFGYAAGTDWSPTASGSPTVSISAGTLFIDGYRLLLQNSLDTSSSAGGLTWSTVGGSDAYGYVYLDITQTEVNATQDPTMATALLGETTVREVLTATFNKVESNAGYEAAFALVPALPAVTNPRIYNGNTARVFLFRYHRPAGTSNITQSMLQELTQPIPGDAINRQKFFKTFRYNATDAAHTPNPILADGMVVWDPVTQNLQIGSINQGTDGAGNSINNAKCGMMYRRSGAGNIDVYIANSVQVQEPQYPATGTGNSPVPLPDPTQGWNIPLGNALGWMVAGPTNHNNMLLRRGTTSPIYDLGASVPYAADPLIIENLAVAPLTSFQADPASFVICANVFNDLIWWNGQVTRGGPSNSTGTGYAAIETPGESPSPYRAIVAATGNIPRPGSNHITGSDALERAMNWSSSSPGIASPQLGTTIPRAIRLFLRGSGDTYVFGRGTKKWGNSSELGLGNSIVWEGEEGEYSTGKPLLSFTNPYTTARPSSDFAVLALVSTTIKMSNLAFQQDSVGSNYKSGYVAYFYGASVTLENCDFYGPVYVKADKIKIKNCRFYGVNVNSGFANLVPFNTPDALSAGLLYLAKAGLSDSFSEGGQIRWDVGENLFVCVPDGFSGGNYCYNSNVVIDTTGGGVGLVKFVNNVFDGQVWEQNIPSIHIAGPNNDVIIDDNVFTGAIGCQKHGNDQFVTAFPFNGDYAGTPILQNIGGSSGAVVACAYVSITDSRGPTSSTKIRNNRFSLVNAANISNSAKPYNLWGACIVALNNASVGGSSASLFNITYTGNHHIMAAASGSVGWVNANSMPALWGFYLCRTLQDGVLLSNLAVQSISIYDNTFDLGGDVLANINTCWRSLVSWNWADFPWPAGGAGYLTDTSACISICLRNFSASSQVGVALSGAGANGITVRGNRILQRQLSPQDTTGSNPNYLRNEMANTSADPSTGALPYWYFYGIVVSGGDVFESGFAGPTGVNTADNPNGNCIVGAVIDSNLVVYQIFQSDPLVSDANLNQAGIFLGTSTYGKVTSNIIMMNVTANSGVGIEVWGSPSNSGNHIHGNNSLAYNGISLSSSGDLADGNAASNHAGAVPYFGGTFTYPNSGTAPGDNFVRS